jgi:hypothetical protein
MSEYFKAAPLSRQIKLLTVATFVILAGTTGILYTTFESRMIRHMGVMIFIVDGLVVCGLLAWAVVSMIRGYEISPGKLVIVRLAGRKEIPLGQDVSAQADQNSMKGSLRKFDNGGFFSITGLFYNSTLGNFHAYVTDTKKSLVIKSSAGTVVISPEKPEECAARLSGQIK